MCKNKCNDIITVFVSALAAIGITLVSFFGILTAFVIGQWIAIGLAVIALLVLTVISTSLLRQNKSLNRCVCDYGTRLAFSSLALLSVALVSVLIPFAVPFIVFITVFILTGLSAYVIMTLYSLIRCFMCSCKAKWDCDRQD